MISEAFYSGVRNSLRSNMRTPGRIKSFIYHAHEFYKTIKKRGKDLYSVCLGEVSSGMVPTKCHPSAKFERDINNTDVELTFMLILCLFFFLREKITSINY